MKKYEIVQKNKDFNDIIKKGKFFRNQTYNIYYKDSENLFPKFGLAISKKCGNAVARNKLKRQLRMIIDNHKKLFHGYKDYIILPRVSIVKMSFKEMEESLVELMKGKN